MKGKRHSVPKASKSNGAPRAKSKAGKKPTYKDAAKQY